MADARSWKVQWTEGNESTETASLQSFRAVLPFIFAAAKACYEARITVLVGVELDQNGFLLPLAHISCIAA
jgi:hypothetical protein